MYGSLYQNVQGSRAGKSTAKDFGFLVSGFGRSGVNVPGFWYRKVWGRCFWFRRVWGKRAWRPPVKPSSASDPAISASPYVESDPALSRVYALGARKSSPTLHCPGCTVEGLRRRIAGLGWRVEG